MASLRWEPEQHQGILRAHSNGTFSGLVESGGRGGTLTCLINEHTLIKLGPSKKGKKFEKIFHLNGGNLDFTSRVIGACFFEKGLKVSNQRFSF